MKKYTKDNIRKTKKKIYKNKKIVLITGPLTFGGSERQIIKLAEELEKKKYDVRICSLWYENKYHTFKIGKNIKVDIIKTSYDPDVMQKYVYNHKLNFSDYSFFSLHEMMHLFKLHDYLIKQRPDVVHAHLDFYCVITGVLAVILDINRALLSTRSMPPHNFVFYRKYFRSAFQALFKYKNITFVNNSKAGSIAYDKWLCFPKNTFKTTYNIYDFRKKIKINKINYKKKNNDKIIGSVLRLDPEKNPLYLLKIFFCLIKKNSNYKFILIGDGKLASRIKKLIKKNCYESKIYLIKNLNNIHDYLYLFDFFVLASRVEGTPNVLLESQHVGTPVFATNVGGVKESIAIPYSGALITGKSFKKDSETIHLFIKKFGPLKKIGLKMIRKKLQHFLPYHSIKKIEQLYNEK